MNIEFWLKLIEVLVPLFVSAINAVGNLKTGEKPIPQAMVPVIVAAIKDAEVAGGDGEQKKADAVAQLAPSAKAQNVGQEVLSRVIDGVVSAANKAVGSALYHAQSS
jgi:hypothetical protein